MQTAAALVAASEGWATVIDVAEIAVGGTAYDAKAVWGANRLAVELLGPDGIWVVSTLVDGSDLTSQPVAISDWEATNPGRPDEGDGIL